MENAIRGAVVKLIGKDEREVAFLLAPWEKPILMSILRLYPVLRPGFQPLSKSCAPDQVPAGQELLEECLTDAKRANRQRLQRFLADRKRFQEAPGGIRFVLEADAVEWFLQILNDIRVGCWYKAGCPDEQEEERDDPSNEFPGVRWTMMATGYFQAAVLGGLEGFDY